MTPNGDASPKAHQTTEGHHDRAIAAVNAVLKQLEQVKFEGCNEEYKPHIKTESSYNDVKQLLQCITCASDELGIEPQNREYRKLFSKNYKALLPDGKWHYRLDVLEASQQGYSTIWVNGERYTFNSAVIHSGNNFRESWKQAIKMFKLMQANRNWLTNEKWKSDLVPILVDLDCKWVDFEQEYIFELIRIEKMARRFVTDVMDYESKLSHIDEQLHNIKLNEGFSDVYTSLKIKHNHIRKEFIARIARLNSVSNNKRKGRDDFTVFPLQAAEHVLTHIELCPGHPYEPVMNLAFECISSFKEFRKYIRDLSSTPEKVDPHLCNNITLVTHLVKIEESWERSQKYLQSSTNLNCLIDIIHFLIAVFDAQRSVEEGLMDDSSQVVSAVHQQEGGWQKTCKTRRAGVTLLRSQRCAGRGRISSLCGKDEAICSTHQGGEGGEEERGGSGGNVETMKCETFEEKVMACDVEAFLALPRFVCFYYLLDPLRHSQILKMFLPQYFQEADENETFNKECIEQQTASKPTSPPEPNQQDTSPAVCSTTLQTTQMLTFNTNDVILPNIQTNYEEGASIASSHTPKSDTSNHQQTEAAITCYCSSVSVSRLSKYLIAPLTENELLFIPKQLQSLIKNWVDLQWFNGFDKNQCGKIRLLMCVITKLMDCEECEERIKKFVGKEADSYKTLLTDLFHHIERVSMDIQRSSPQDWNEFLQTLLLCLQSYRKYVDDPKEWINKKEFLKPIAY